MSEIDLLSFISKLTIGFQIDESNAFLKGYDKNNNSIFDAEEIENLEKDLAKADRNDKNEGLFTEVDLQEFFKILAKRSKNKDICDLEILTIWVQAVTNSKLEELSKLRRHEKYANLSDMQKKYLETYVVNAENLKIDDSLIDDITSVPQLRLNKKGLKNLPDLLSNDDLKDLLPHHYVKLAIMEPEKKKNFEELLDVQKKDASHITIYELLYFADNIASTDLETLKFLMRAELGEEKNRIYPDVYLEILKLNEEKRQKVLDIFSLPNIPSYMHHGIITLMEVEQFLPEDFFKNNSDFVVTSTADKVGYILNPDKCAQKYLYDNDKGLVEIQLENEEDNTLRVVNSVTGTEHIIKYADIKSKKQVLSETINHYSKVELNNGTYSFANLQNTIQVSEAGQKGVQNVTQTDFNGNVLTLQFSDIEDDGTVSIERNFSSAQGVKTEYSYKIKPNGEQELYYKIIDVNGKVLLDKQQSITEVSENTYLTTINEKQFEATFKDNRLVITDKANSDVKIFDLNDVFIPEGKNIIVELLQRVPANMLMVMDKIPLESIMFDADNSDYLIESSGGGCFNNAKDQIAICNNTLGPLSLDNNYELANSLLGMFVHEYGHYLDSSENKDDNTNWIISSNENLNKIFKEEYEAFLANSDTIQQNFVDYFISKDFAKRSAGERVAEAIMLLNTSAVTGLETRVLYYQQNFPKTIALISHLLDERLGKLSE